MRRPSPGPPSRRAGASSHFVRFIEIYKANAIAASRYRPEALTAVGKTVVFRAADGDPDLELSEARDPTLGWGSLLRLPPLIEQIPGTHLTMFSEAHAAVLAERIFALGNQ